MEFYKNLDEILTKKHITKMELCNSIGLSYNTLLSASRRKSKNLSYGTINKIANYLGCSTDYLFNGKDENQLKKVAVITGASGDIGSAIALNLAQSGYTHMALIYKSNKTNALNLKSLLEANCNAEIFKCDLTNEKETEDIVNKIINKFNQIDCLVNCAGVSHFQQIQDTTEQDYNKVFNNNIKSTILITKFVSKNMISAKSGKIVNISSIWGSVGASVESLYSASKGAVNTLTLALAKELAPSGINVNCICPGFIKGKMNSTLSSSAIQNIINSTPLMRAGLPDDVANLVSFLCSSKSDFITGQIITVDGGLTL